MKRCVGMSRMKRRADEQNEATQNGVALSNVEQKNVTHKNAI